MNEGLSPNGKNIISWDKSLTERNEETPNFGDLNGLSYGNSDQFVVVS